MKDVYSEIFKRIPKGAKVLELGCGTALEEAHYCLRKKCRIFCLDKKKIDFPFGITSDFRKIPLGNNLFFLVYSRSAIQYGTLRENLALARKIFKALQEGGFFLGTLHSPRDAMVKKSKATLKNAGEPGTFIIGKDQLVHFFNKKDIKLMLSDFKIEYIKEIRFKDKAHDGLEAHWHHAYEFLAQKK